MTIASGHVSRPVSGPIVRRTAARDAKVRSDYAPGKARSAGCQTRRSHRCHPANEPAENIRRTTTVWDSSGRRANVGQTVTPTAAGGNAIPTTTGCNLASRPFRLMLMHRQSGPAARMTSLIATGLLLVACTGAQPAAVPPQTPPVRSATAITASVTSSAAWPQQSNNGFRFHRPPTWHPYPFVVGGTMTTITGYLSTTPLHHPCATTTTAKAITETCGTPIGTLPKDGVLVTLGGFDGGHRPDRSSTANTTVAHRPAVLTETAALTDCRTVHGSRQIHLRVFGDLTGKHGDIQMTGCFAGPNTANAESNFQQLVHSISYSQ